MAEFCHGFVFECDVPEPGMLTVEGVRVEGFERTAEGTVRAPLPDTGDVISAPTVRMLVGRYVRHTGARAARKKQTRAQLAILRDGKSKWNAWRRQNPTVQPMLAAVDASKQFPNVCLDGYDFSYANFTGARLCGVSLNGANFHQAILANTNLSGACLEKANFCRTDLYLTNFAGARLQGANLQGVQLAKTNLSGANVDGCNVYGMSAWDLNLTGASQQNLRITYQPAGEEEERKELVDSLDLASFMYLTLCNQNIARIIDAACRKWVLILGRFTTGREVLDAVVDVVRQERFIPVIFDFNRPHDRDLIETILLLAGMSAFVVVEISDPKSTPLELHAIATNYGVPIFPIMESGSDGFSLFAPLRRFRWVFPPMTYDNVADLKKRLPGEVFALARNEMGRLTQLKSAVEAQQVRGDQTNSR